MREPGSASPRLAARLLKHLLPAAAAALIAAGAMPALAPAEPASDQTAGGGKADPGDDGGKDDQKLPPGQDGEQPPGRDKDGKDNGKKKDSGGGTEQPGGGAPAPAEGGPPGSQPAEPVDKRSAGGGSGRGGDSGGESEPDESGGGQPAAAASPSQPKGAVTALSQPSRAAPAARPAPARAPAVRARSGAGRPDRGASGRRGGARHRATGLGLLARLGGAVPSLAPLAAATAGAGRDSGGKRAPGGGRGGGRPRTVVEKVREIVEVVPRALWVALGALAALALALAAGTAGTAARSRRLRRQRTSLLEEVGLLQEALLPPVPPRLGLLDVSVVYRPAEGPAAGGDFYDVFAAGGGRVGALVGDVSGHGRESLARTALLRYGLRAYLEAGMSPRLALQLAGQTLAADLGEEFATVAAAVYDPEAGELTYACAGHPAPVIVVDGDRGGAGDHLPAGGPASYPLGIGLLTGLRQTTVSFAPGMTACLFTDGVLEARRDGHFFGRTGIAAVLAGRSGRAREAPAEAAGVIAGALEWSAALSDDAAVCVLRPRPGAPAGPGRRLEEFEAGAEDVRRGDVAAFLAACGVEARRAAAAARQAAERARGEGRVLVRVERRAGVERVEVLAPGVVSIGAASAPSATMPRISGAIVGSR